MSEGAVTGNGLIFLSSFRKKFVCVMNTEKLEHRRPDDISKTVVFCRSSDRAS